MCFVVEFFQTKKTTYIPTTWSKSSVGTNKGKIEYAFYTIELLGEHESSGGARNFFLGGLLKLTVEKFFKVSQNRPIIELFKFSGGPVHHFAGI